MNKEKYKEAQTLIEECLISLYPLSLEELASLKVEWLKELEDLRMSERIKNLCSLIIQTVIDGKLEA